MKMNLKERAEMIRAMDTICRSINDEDVFIGWLIHGVADGDIDENTTDEDLEWYCEDKTFADLMHYFLILMNRARKSGGLYCDGVVDKEEE